MLSHRVERLKIIGQQARFDMISSKLGLIRTPKEKLVAVILEALRHIAPAAGYHFIEFPGSVYQLTLYLGSRSTKLLFTQEQALSADTEQGKERVAAQLCSALLGLTVPQPLKRAS
jgi:hypothetical protein